MSIDSSAKIHPNAVIEDGARIAKNCAIGPFCVVGAGVRLGENTVLKSHVVIAGNTQIGKDCTIYPFASIGHAPQDLKYKGEDNSLIIGDKNRIREHVTISPGTPRAVELPVLAMIICLWSAVILAMIAR